MNQKLEYAREKLHNAVLALSVGSGTIQSRLQVAGRELLILTYHGSLTGELVLVLSKIKKELTSKQPKSHEGRLAATIRGMRKKKASEFARRIFDLYHDVLRELNAHK
ncbi:MAG TPA: hypothetical protein VFE58_07570 [Tepidisphaeraceae bacterium]|jgi:hypothetical protein|nr:hypothetical protein [Tepidisphaeraceae bacterium]